MESTAPETISPAYEVLNKLDQETQRVNDAIHELEHRLEPVMEPLSPLETDAEVAVKAKPKVSSPYFARLVDIMKEVELQYMSLDSILFRLEI